VAEDGKYGSILEGQRPYLFLPAPRREARRAGVETAATRGAIPYVRQALREAGPDIDILSLTTLRQYLRIAFSAPKMSLS